MRKTLLCLLITGNLACNAVSHAGEYSVMGLSSPVVDWNCAGFFCKETTPTAILIGFGNTFRDDTLSWEIDAFFTVDKGHVNSLEGSGQYAVHGFGAYGLWRTNSAVSLSVRAGLAHTQVDGPDGATASGTHFAPAFGVGIGFGKRLLLEMRVLNSDVNSFNISYRFD